MNAHPLLIFVRDLMFAGRIIAEARAQGVEFKVVREASRLMEEPGARLIVDLNQEGALDAAMQWRARHGGRVIGFASHVDTDTIKRARERGVDQVLTRGGFTMSLADILRQGAGDNQ